MSALRRLVSVIAVTGAVAMLAACSSGTDATSSPTSREASGATSTTAPARASGPSAGCEVTPSVALGTTDERIAWGGAERSYQLIVPQVYDGKSPLPLVITPHSLTIDYHVVPTISGIPDMASSYDFITVSPSGLLGPGGKPYWNAAPVPDNYDLAFLTELLDHLEATLCIDTGRVFSVGMSNGAQVSSMLACRLGNRIAGIAPIAGVEYNEPCDGPPVRVIAFHGFADPIVPYAGGGLNSLNIAKQNYYRSDGPGGTVPAGTPTPAGVDESMSRWAKHNGCDPDPVEERVSPEVRKRTWQNCDAATELYIVDNGGHAWPGKPQPAFEAQFGHGTTEIDATTLLFKFLFDNEG